MSDDLDRLVDAIESEGPSPEFVAALRARIVAETEGPAATAPPVHRDDLDVVVLRPAEAARPTTGKRWVPIGMVAAAVALIIGLVVLSRQDDGVEMIDQPSVTTDVPDAIVVPPPTFVADATRFAGEDAPLEPGTYRVDEVGTSFSLTLDQPLHASTDHGLLFLAHPQVQGDDDRSIIFTRLTALSDPARPIVAPSEAVATWPADDLDGWLAAVSDEVVVANRTETTLGGLAATRIDLELGATECTVGAGSCGWFGTNSSVHDHNLFPGSQYRIWVVDQGEHDPLAVIVAIDREADREWFDTAEAILSTVAFGEVAPNPIVAGEPGLVDLPVFGGVRVELPDGSFAEREHDGFVRVVLDEWPGETVFATDPLDAGRTIASTDEVVAMLRAGGADMTELEPAIVGGVDARVFDVEAAPAQTLRLAAEPDSTWTLPLRGRLWLVEHPDRGLLIIAAGASENLDIVTPLALDQATALIESLEFTEPG